jgi:6-pyruvoyltetrahydropterin/6-carboxytetrahydropterin synthase
MKETGLVYLTRVVEFCAAHKLYREDWDEALNQQVFGKCANPNYHGHNFTLEVTVVGKPDPVTGFVLNFTELKQILKEWVEDPIDHKNLNLDVPFMKGVIPTMENLLIQLWNVLEPRIPAPARLYRLRIFETNRNIVEYYGPGDQV